MSFTFVDSPLTDQQKESILSLADLCLQPPIPEKFKHEANDVSINQESSAKQERKFKSSSLHSYALTEDMKLYKCQLGGYASKCEELQQVIDTSTSTIDVLNEKYCDTYRMVHQLHLNCEALMKEEVQLKQHSELFKNYLSYFEQYDGLSAKLNNPLLPKDPKAIHPLLVRLDECLHFLHNHSTFKESGPYITKYMTLLERALVGVKEFIGKLLTETVDLINAAITGEENEAPLKTTVDVGFAFLYGKFRLHSSKIKPLTDMIASHIHQKRGTTGEVEVYGTSDTYQECLRDIERMYFGQRIVLLMPTIVATMNDLFVKYQKDRCTLLRSSGTILLNMCEDEYQLYLKFFPSPKSVDRLDQLHDTLYSFCTTWYDSFRPIAIHIYHLETLSEMCSIIRQDLLIYPSSGPDHPPYYSAFITVVEKLLADLQGRLVFRTQIIIRDTILNFKPSPGDLAYPKKLLMMRDIAQAEAAKPKPTAITTTKRGDDNSDAESTLGASTKSNLAFFVESSQSPADMHGMWYPTVRRTLTCLFKLRMCLDDSSFEMLSQECISMCAQSLYTAAMEIEALNRKERSPSDDLPVKLDSLLFLIKHMLIIREQLSQFNIDATIVERRLSFATVPRAIGSLVKDAATNVMSAVGRRDVKKSSGDGDDVSETKSTTGASILGGVVDLAYRSNTAFLHFLVSATPEVHETHDHPRKSLDGQVAAACKEFIQLAIEAIVLPLQNLNNKVAVVVAELSKVDGATDESIRRQLRAQPFTAVEQVKSVVTVTYKRNLHSSNEAECAKHRIIDKMRLYLSNADTEAILFKPIRAGVLSCFQTFLDNVLKPFYTDEEVAIIAAPTIPHLQLALMPRQRNDDISSA